MPRFLWAGSISVLRLSRYNFQFLGHTWPHDVFPSRSARSDDEKKVKIRKIVFRSISNLLLLKMTEEKGSYIWPKSLYKGFEKKMTRAYAIHPPSGARNKSQKETPHKHSICARHLKMCWASHLCSFGASLVERCGSMTTNQITWEKVSSFCHDYLNFHPSNRPCNVILFNLAEFIKCILIEFDLALIGDMICWFRSAGRFIERLDCVV